MYEIELKAHVDDREAVIAALNGFATFCGEVQKYDTYYKLHQDGKKISARIRAETKTDAQKKTDSRILLTYKHKELQTTANGAAIEVNDEKECALSSADALTALLTDIGFAVSLTKTKQVLSWEYDGALFELCTVPPLGDSLEIELLSPCNDQSVVATLQQKLQDLLAKTGISADRIEKRYYSDMLREANNHA